MFDAHPTSQHCRITKTYETKALHLEPQTDHDIAPPNPNLIPRSPETLPGSLLVTLKPQATRSVSSRVLGLERPPYTLNPLKSQQQNRHGKLHLWCSMCVYIYIYIYTYKYIKCASSGFARRSTRGL